MQLRPGGNRRPNAALLAGATAVAVGLAIVGWLAATRGWHDFIKYDARYFHTVAQDLDASHAERGDSAYRYGRIGLPFLARVLAGGSTGTGLDVAQMLVTPLAAGVLVGSSVAIAERTTGRWRSGLVVLLVPGLWLGFRAAWADTLLAACVLLSVWATLQRRQVVCMCAILAAAVTKEVGALAAVPAAMASLARRELGAAAGRVLALVPALAWWAWVRLQSGEWPFLAEEPARAKALSLPLLDIFGALTGGRGDPLSAMVALIVGTVGLVVLVQHRDDMLAWSAGVWGFMTLCLGDNVLEYPGDALRVMTPGMCVILLAAHLLGRAPEAAAPLPYRSSVPT